MDAFVNNTSVPRLFIFSGAGLSAESGIRTFRDCNTGLWEEHDIDKVCNIKSFQENYDVVHKFYDARRQQLANVSPNIAHIMIAEWQKQYGEDRVCVVTANVDDLLERAGATQVDHVHGELTKVIYRYRQLDEYVVDIGYKSAQATHFQIHGIQCKPAVVMFGESSRYKNGVKVGLYEDMEYAIRSLTAKDTFICIGTSDVVVPMWFYACQTPAWSIRVNPECAKENTYNSEVLEKACTAVPKLDTTVQDRMTRV